MKKVWGHNIRTNTDELTRLKNNRVLNS